MTLQARFEKAHVPYSPEGLRVAVLIEEWIGLHHLPNPWARYDWSDTFVEVFSHEPMATFDFDRLTRLVVLAHKHRIRVDVSPAMRYLRLQFHPRNDSADIYTGHPGLTELARKVQDAIPTD